MTTETQSTWRLLFVAQDQPEADRIRRTLASCMPNVQYECYRVSPPKSRLNSDTTLRCLEVCGVSDTVFDSLRMLCEAFSWGAAYGAQRAIK